MSLLAVDNVCKTYPDGTTALSGVSLQATAGRTLGIVGESGSGKSTLARAILGLEPVDSGAIYFEDLDITTANTGQLRSARKNMQLVFQNPRTSLNSRMTIQDSLLETLRARRSQQRRAALLDGRTETEFAQQWVQRVHLDPAVLQRYPRALSGGQLQRIAIARALSTQAKMVILDEPTASLDVSVQASVLNLLKDLQEQLATTFLFISHDLAAVRFLADDIVVMRRGHVVDSCAAADITAPQRSDYTQQLVQLFRQT